jgi:hypothetical protein
MASLDDSKTSMRFHKNCDSPDFGLIQQYGRAAVRENAQTLLSYGGRSIVKGARFVKKKGAYRCSFSITQAIRIRGCIQVSAEEIRKFDEIQGEGDISRCSATGLFKSS